MRGPHRRADRDASALRAEDQRRPSRPVGRRLDGRGLSRDRRGRDPDRHADDVGGVSFRLRRVRSERLHRLFRLESELNTILFAGFPGFVSKLWFVNDERGVYQGCTTGATPPRPRRTSARCGGP